MTGVFFLVIVIVATVYFMRSKHHDDLDKKSSHHLPLPMDYASNEGISNYKYITITILLLVTFYQEKHLSKRVIITSQSSYICMSALEGSRYIKVEPSRM